MKIGNRLNDESSISKTLLNLGALYGKASDPKAYDFYFRALALKKKIGDELGEAITLLDIGETYTTTGEYVKALNYEFNALKLFKKLDDRGGIVWCMGNIGDIYLYIAQDSTKANYPDSLKNKNALRKSVDWLSRSVVLAKETGNIDPLQNHLPRLSEAEFLLGRYKDAYRTQRDGMAVRDSIYSQENKDKIQALTKQHEEDLKQKEIDLQKVEIAKAKQERWFYSMGLVALLLIAGLVTLFLVNTRKAKRLSDHLLHNILPVHTANELKANGSTKPRHYANVSVLFTDFKEFAKLAERLSADETVSIIHHYFTAFDGIVEKYDLEKIKTIGDAYMAAAGVPVENPNHAFAATKAAIAIRDFVTAEKQIRQQSGEPYFDVRIGVHSGPVVAGIVGVKKFAYDIWGDTVNLAARMEQSGEPGKVNVSGSTFELIKNDFVCYQRGNVQIKHGGLVEMYFVESEVANAVPA